MKLKVMSFNLRIAAESDGINYLPHREHRILQTIRAEAPDLIGFQEAGDEARARLKNVLSDRYTVLGCGRNPNYRGESCILAFRKDCFELIHLTTQFLSDTPTVPGSRYESSDQSKCPRLFVHAQLSHDDSDTPIHFINTHLDHKGEGARVLGMTQILNYAEGLSGKFILTGDMNAKPDSACIALTRARGIHEVTEEITHTFHGFGKYKEGVKIDYIFTNATPLSAYRIEDDPADGIYISDHHPVCGWIELDS